MGCFCFLFCSFADWDDKFGTPHTHRQDAQISKRMKVSIDIFKAISWKFLCDPVLLRWKRNYSNPLLMFLAWGFLYPIQKTSSRDRIICGETNIGIALPSRMNGANKLQDILFGEKTRLTEGCTWQPLFPSLPSELSLYIFFSVTSMQNNIPLRSRDYHLVFCLLRGWGSASRDLP